MNSRGRCLLALLLGIYLLTAGGYLADGDEETMFRVTRNLAWGQGVAVGREELTLVGQNALDFLPAEAMLFPSTSAVPGVDNGLYSKYALGQSLLAIPFFSLGTGLDLLSTVWPQLNARFVVALVNPVVLAVTGWLLFRLTVALGYAAKIGFLLAVAFAVATVVWPYANTFYPQPTVGLLLLLVAFAVQQWEQSRNLRWTWIIGVALAVAVLVRSAVVITLPGVAVALWMTTHTWAERRAAAWRIGLLLAAGVAVSLFYNWLRFGSPFDSGYYEVAWTTPPLLGLYGLLFSPGKGIFLYTPLLLLSVAALPLFWQAHRHLAVMIGLWWLAFLAFYAPYNFWTGGVNWGPRFLLPLVAVSLLPVATILTQSKGRAAMLLFGLLVAIGVIIQLPAVMVDHVRYLAQQSQTGDARFYDRTVFQPAFSPLARQWPSALAVMSNYSRPDRRQAAADSLQLMPLPPAADSATNRQSAQRVLQTTFVRLNLPAIWWLHLPLWDVSGWFIVLLMLPCLALLLWGTWGIYTYEW